MKDYVFSLELDNEIMDMTALEENNPDLAKDLFLKEYGWEKILSKKEKARAIIVLETTNLVDEFGDILAEGF